MTDNTDRARQAPAPVEVSRLAELLKQARSALNYVDECCSRTIPCAIELDRVNDVVAKIDDVLASLASTPVGEPASSAVLAHNVSEMCKGALRIPNMPWPDAGAHGLDAYCRAVHRSFCDLRFKLIDIMREAEAHLVPQPDIPASPSDN